MGNCWTSKDDQNNIIEDQKKTETDLTNNNIQITNEVAEPEPQPPANPQEEPEIVPSLQSIPQQPPKSVTKTKTKTVTLESHHDQENGIKSENFQLNLQNITKQSEPNDTNSKNIKHTDSKNLSPRSIASAFRDELAQDLKVSEDSKFRSQNK